MKKNVRYVIESSPTIEHHQNIWCGIEVQLIAFLSKILTVAWEEKVWYLLTDTII